MEAVAPLREEEPPGGDEAPEEYVVRLSRAKADEVAASFQDAIVLAADTAVVIDGAVLGKPLTASEATAMLHRLRGRPHTVMTGLTAVDVATGPRTSTVKRTAVTMRSYSNDEIAAYVASGEPFDKAGAYAVQDPWFRPAETVEGCYLNVVGLPMCVVSSLLEQIGADLRLKAEWSPPAECQDCPLRERTEAPVT